MKVGFFIYNSFVCVYSESNVETNQQIMEYKGNMGDDCSCLYGGSQYSDYCSYCSCDYCEDENCQQNYSVYNR